MAYIVLPSKNLKYVFKFSVLVATLTSTSRPIRCSPFISSIARTALAGLAYLTNPYSFVLGPELTTAVPYSFLLCGNTRADTIVPNRANSRSSRRLSSCGCRLLTYRLTPPVASLAVLLVARSGVPSRQLSSRNFSMSFQNSGSKISSS
uniref:Uncharacterized protein n=1 Tax=Cacopsylla melanoneura TaxID=428564 RepID=A0A8D8YJZ0_9HEMI